MLVMQVGGPRKKGRRRENERIVVVGWLNMGVGIRVGRGELLSCFLLGS